MQNGTSSYSEASGSRIQSNGVIQRPGLKDKHTEPWPTLSPEALYGLAGDIVKANDPFTEADQVAILANLLVMFGNVINANAHFLVEHTKHFFRLFVNFVGESAKGRKGQSLSTPRHIFSQVDSNWEKDCVTGGLSSGEGLIYAVRDARHDKDGAVIDPGVSDKRLLLIEEELAGVLKVATREGNSQSAILRQGRIRAQDPGHGPRRGS